MLAWMMMMTDGIIKAVEEEKKITGGLKKTLKRVIQGLIFMNDVKTFFFLEINREIVQFRGGDERGKR